MDFFSNTKPKILSGNIKYNLKNLNIDDVPVSFYQKYIEHNLFVLIMFAILACVLIILYLLKRKNTENFRFLNTLCQNKNCNIQIF